MTDPRNRLVEIGKQFLADRKLFASLLDAARRLTNTLPSFSRGSTGAQGVTSFQFAEREYLLLHRLTWTPTTHRSALLLRLRHQPFDAPPAAAAEIRAHGAVWLDGADGPKASGLSLPGDAVEILALLLSHGGA